MAVMPYRIKKIRDKTIKGASNFENSHSYRNVRCERCDRLLGIFESAKGDVKCPRCKHIQKIDLKND